MLSTQKQFRECVTEEILDMGETILLLMEITAAITITIVAAMETIIMEVQITAATTIITIG